jgi:hypothetical protein
VRTYELELDYPHSVVIKSYPHTRLGLTTAFKDIETCLRRLVNATIISQSENKEEIVFKLNPE